MGGALLLATVPWQPLKKEVSYIMLPFHPHFLPPSFSYLPSTIHPSLPPSLPSSISPSLLLSLSFLLIHYHVFPCVVPANLSAPVVAALSSSTISITWSAPEEPNGVIIIYTIFL